MSDSAPMKRALREQGEFLRVERARWVARVRRAAALDRDLPLVLLADRFGCSEEQVERVTSDIPRVRDGFARRR